MIKQVSADKTVLFSSHIMQEVQALCSRVLIINEESDENEVFMSDWVLITSNEELTATPAISDAVVPWGDESEIVWTDDYSNLLGVLND